MRGRKRWTKGKIFCITEKYKQEAKDDEFIIKRA